MSRESRANDRDRGDDHGLEDKVSTFGGDLSGLSGAELERQAEAYLEAREGYLKEQAEDYLGFEGTWTSPEVDRGGD